MSSAIASSFIDIGGQGRGICPYHPARTNQLSARRIGTAFRCPARRRTLVDTRCLSFARGRILAVGQNDAYSDPSVVFTLYEWPSRKEVAKFDAYFRGLVWADAHHLKVTCIANDGNRGFDAVVRRDSLGKWRMQVTRWLRPQMLGTMLWVLGSTLRRFL